MNERAVVRGVMSAKEGLKGSAKRGMSERGHNDIKCEIFGGNEKASK